MKFKRSFLLRVYGFLIRFFDDEIATSVEYIDNEIRVTTIPLKARVDPSAEFINMFIRRILEKKYGGKVKGVPGKFVSFVENIDEKEGKEVIAKLYDFFENHEELDEAMAEKEIL